MQQLTTELLVFKFSFVEPDVKILEKSLIMLLTMAELLSLQKIRPLLHGLVQQKHTALKNIHDSKTEAARENWWQLLQY